jgi:hypothetical protein
MVTKIRLGWETRLDQLTLTFDFALIGVGLIVLGSFVGSVLLIIAGSLVSLVILIRLNGWRTLIWPRNLTIGPDGIADDTKKRTAFHVRWPDLTAVGVITEPDGMTLVFSLRKATRQYRIPRRPEVLPALRKVATCPVNELPPPPVGNRVTIEVGKRLAAQTIVGAAVAALFGYAGLGGALDSGGPTWARIVAGLVGTPLALIVLTTVLSLPVTLRKRQIVIDETSFTWFDPTEQSFTVTWDALSGLGVDTTVVKNMKSGNRYSVHVLLRPGGPDFAETHREMAKFVDDDHYDLPLGPLPDVGARVAEAVSRLAPAVWLGTNEHRGRFGIT